MNRKFRNSIMQEHTRVPRSIFFRALLVGLLVAGSSAQAQWVTTYEQFYLQAPHNWVFRNNYQAADRLFNAFDYGHAWCTGR